MAKSVKRYGQNLFSGPKKDPNSVFQPRNFFWLNWSKNGQKLYFGPEKDPNSDFWPKIKFLAKNDQKLIF